MCCGRNMGTHVAGFRGNKKYKAKLLPHRKPLVSATNFVGGGFREKHGYVDFNKSRVTIDPLNSSQPAPSNVSDIGADYVGRSYVQLTGTASLNPKYLSAVDIRTKNEDTPNLCYGCRSDAGGYGEGELVSIYGGLGDGLVESYNSAEGSVTTDVTFKYQGDGIWGRSNSNARSHTSQTKNSKPRRVGGGFVFYDSEGKPESTTLPKWVRMGAAETLSKEKDFFHVDKLKEPDGPVYAPTIPRETRSPVPQFVRDRQVHGPDMVKPSIYESKCIACQKALMKHNTNKGDHTDDESSMTSGLGTSISSEVLQRQRDEEREEARLKAEEERRAQEEAARRKVEEEQQRKKDELRKDLYKAPKAFKIKPNETKSTVAIDPFSQNRSYDIPQSKEFEIKKSSKAVTQTQEFRRRDSDWKEPKKFELKKDTDKKTTEFWEPPKKTEKAKIPVIKSKLKPVPSILPSPSPFPSPSPSPSPISPVEELLVDEENKEEPEPVEPVGFSPEPPTSPPPPPVVVVENREESREPSPTPVQIIPDSKEEKEEVDVHDEPDIETRVPSSTNSADTHPIEQPPTPDRYPTPDYPSEIPRPPSDNEPTPPPEKEQTPIPPREPTPPPPKDPPPKPPPLPQIDDTNPNLKTTVKETKPKYQQKKINKRKKIPPVKKPKQVELPKLPIVPERIPPEPEPPPPLRKPVQEPLVLPPLPATPVIQPKEETPPPRTPTPIPLPSPVAPKREPIIWKRKMRKLKKSWNRPKRTSLPESPDPILRDPLDCLAKYCIVQKTRIGFYQRVFREFTNSKKDSDEYFEENTWDSSFSTADVTAQPSFISSTSKSNDFQNTFVTASSTAESPDAEEYISPTEIAKAESDNRKTSDSPTSDLEQSTTLSSGVEPSEDSILLQARLDKLNFILDNVYSKIEKLYAQIYEHQEQYETRVKQLARTELLEKTVREQGGAAAQNETGKKKKKGGKGKKATKKDDKNHSTITVGATPEATPRGSPRASPAKMRQVDLEQLTDDQIVARTSSATMRMIENDPNVRKAKLAQGRANEKLEDMERWLSELKEESSLITAQVSEQKRREEVNRAAANPEFRRAQSGLYNKMNPLEEHDMNISDIEPLLQQVNGQLITKKECQYVYHVLNLPQRHKLNFKLFTVVAALSEKVSRLEPFVKKMINKMDFEALDVKMQRAKELFQLLEDEDDETYPGEVTIDNLSVELQAGGLSKDNIKFVVNKFGREGNGIVDFLDFLTYLPLFIDIHGNIINDPFNQGVMHV
ncbi:uncharacterized protein [Antedon mediterranea]|uniref:uncharacterized protein isoform X2 n=1 Tax=Antedon mediterranea TaxID=105859 RepID=UPI003AF4EDF4